MDQLSHGQLLSLLLPLVVIELALKISAIVACVRSERTRGPKWLWLLVIVFVSTFGPIAFFLFGRKPA
ncbi:Phospholipase_D-nuclease N-terminal [Paenibacillus sp. UNC496MF]|uniref:PLD nuclease N-terminal domain-containing protein n=1 Tax=Paenibacillus sp. UNC496MF TaxID=1502753 RepID=UPI0008F1F8EF|nr:PLD nuclease N-terminal domain-containing protein [Paenibacillus sp. UNC496MF]SFJ45626.1 Phospholipase_D-nuclease N-terminal [Paenibacillus sp. UNC496MF]